MTIRGLKTKITFNVALLLLVSALVTDALVVLLIQSVWVRHHVEREKHHYRILAGNLLAPPFSTDAELALDEKQAPMHAVTEQTQRNPLLIMSANRQTRFFLPGTEPENSHLQKAALSSLLEKKETQQYLNYTWTIFWRHPATVILAGPVFRDDKIMGAVAAEVALSPIHDTIKKYNKLVFIYILINSAVLTLVGLYRIFRIYLRPIDRIINQADEYREEDDLFFTFRREDNELNRLSLALNRMLKRIASDKQKLLSNVVSLEKANLELRKAQNEVIRAEKMAGVGRLAAGLAHEIGNPIGIVLGYLDLLKDLQLGPTERLEFIARAQQETQRMHRVISQLLDLARPKEAEASQVGMHEIITDVADMMRFQPIMQNNTIELCFEAANDRVWANGEQLRQVLLNLLINAADAIVPQTDPGQGRIRIHTRNRPNAERTGGDDLLIRVTDNGQGIAAADLDNIFDPFYTTKEPGKGTGLGLAVSFMIVEKAGGTITAESEPGRGTTIAIRVPVAGAAATDQEQATGDSPSLSADQHGKS